MNEQLRVGIVGTGIGSLHIAALQSLPDLFRVQAICDIDEARAHAVAAQYNVPHATTSLAELCRRDDIDVIHICTPPYLHYEQALQVLEARRHVILEKPVAGSLQHVDELIRAETGSGKRVMPIFQYRFGHGAQKLKLLIDRGLTGRAYLTTAETSWRRRPEYYAVPWRGKWRTELGGPIVSQAIHAHDLIYYLLGPVRNVFARSTKLVNPVETEDCVSASLEMSDGSLCSLSVTIGSAREISRHRFCFRDLTAESNTEPYANTADPWMFAGDTPEIQESIDSALQQFQPLPEGFAGQFYRFFHALKDGTEIPVTLNDSRAALELITALYESARTRQAVSLPISDDHPYYSGWQPSSE
ncbi:MAG TPA: Gfo/Idh/MocA family oxidoreductase [Anaerolineales bacterium]|nr:Gfo/Idh/MocA family oxidoreductase [Anaerolineales bacterium]